MTTGPGGGIKERPIFFSGEMVQAILRGEKTQTRRVVKNAHGAFWDHGAYYPKEHLPGVFRFYLKKNEEFAPLSPAFHCPYGQPGDQLWVKETWGIWQRNDSTPGGKPYDPSYIYLATDPKPDIPDFATIEPFRWKSARFMPHKISRITLEIIGVRVERVQDISEEDAKAEGADNNHACHWPDDDPGYMYDVYRRNYSRLWDRLNSKRGYSWKENPWVWVIEFKRIRS